MVHWSKNTPFVTFWVTLWITAFYEEKAKLFFITLQHLKEFYHFIAKLKINYIVLNGNLDNIFQILEQKYAITELVGGFDTCESF